MGRSDTSSTPALAIEAERQDGSLTVQLTGDLDLAGASVLEGFLAEVPWEEVRQLVFDLHGVSFMDSSGLSLLISAWQRAGAEDRQFSLRRVPSQPRRVLDLTGLAARLNVQS